VAADCGASVATAGNSYTQQFTDSVTILAPQAEATATSPSSVIIIYFSDCGACFARLCGFFYIRRFYSCRFGSVIIFEY
jgi:hypothetical protein